MKKIMIMLCFLLCLCACQKQASEPEATALTYKNLDYKITRITDVENDDNFMPYFTRCDNDYLYGMMLNGAEFTTETNTNRLLVLENDWIRSFPLEEEPCVSDHLMIKDQLFYLAASKDEKNSVDLYRYEDGKNDELIERFTDESKIQLEHLGTSLMIIAQNQERIDLKRYFDDNLIQMATVAINDQLSGDIEIKLYQSELFLTVINDQGKSIYVIDTESGNITSQLTDQAFDYFVVSDDAVAVYQGEKELLYNRSFELQKTYSVPKSDWMNLSYFGDNEGIGVLTDAEHNIVLRNYDNDNGYKISAKKEAVLKDLTVRFVGNHFLIATTAENDIYKIEFEFKE